jgi:hypothetical protein
MEIKNKTPEFITIPQATKLAVGLMPHFVRQLCKKHKVEFLMSGTRYSIRKDSFLSYIGGSDDSLD